MKQKQKRASIAPATKLARGGSSDKGKTLALPKLLDDSDPGRKVEFLNPWTERKQYLEHLNRLRRAHAVEIRNVRMTLIAVADEVVTNKVNAFQKVIEYEFDRFLKQNLELQARLNESK